MEGLSVWILKMGDWEYPRGWAARSDIYDGGKIVGVFASLEDAEAFIPRPDQLYGSNIEPDGSITDRYVDVELWTHIKKWSVHEALPELVVTITASTEGFDTDATLDSQQSRWQPYIKRTARTVRNTINEQVARLRKSL